VRDLPPSKDGKFPLFFSWSKLKLSIQNAFLRRVSDGKLLSPPPISGGSKKKSKVKQRVKLKFLIRRRDVNSTSIEIESIERWSTLSEVREVGRLRMEERARVSKTRTWRANGSAGYRRCWDEIRFQQKRWLNVSQERCDGFKLFSGFLLAFARRFGGEIWWSF
jgi:hypothetical protein